MQSLKVAVDLPRSTVRDAAVRIHAADLDLSPVFNDDGGYRLEPVGGADGRTENAAGVAARKPKEQAEGF